METEIRKIADRIVDGHDTEWNMDIEHFDWVPGVGLYGIWQAYRYTGDARYIAFLNGWAGRHLQEAYAQKTVNSIAPLLTVLSMCEDSPKPEYLKVCRDLGDYVLHEAPRTVDGGLEHTVTEKGPGFADQVWADTLFMVCIFLAKLWKATGERAYLEFALNQLKIHHRLLADGNGLYFHGYNGAQKNHMSAVRWARANAWIIYATMEILNVAGAFAGRSELEALVRNHAKALAKVQAENGGFRTVLDDTAAYVEISATAGIAAGIKLAADAGVLDEAYLTVYKRAAAAIQNAILQDGSVGGVSTGTPVMQDAEAYKKIPVVPTLYGQGLAIIALSLA